MARRVERKGMACSLALLLVNDDADGLFLLDHALRREFPDAEIILCRSAVEAMDCLTRRAVDAIVTDNRMPAVTGIDMVRAIRASGRHLPIIMLTGSDEKRQEALAAGVSSFISAGDWTDIRREIRRAIEATGIRPSSPEH